MHFAPAAGYRVGRGGLANPGLRQSGFLARLLTSAGTTATVVSRAVSPPPFDRVWFPRPDGTDSTAKRRVEFHPVTLWFPSRARHSASDPIEHRSSGPSRDALARSSMRQGPRRSRASDTRITFSPTQLH